MSEKAGQVNSVGSICTGREAWKIRVRLVRKWDVCPASDPSNPFAVQLVLIDQEGNKIEATIRKSFIRKFRGELMEGNVYKIIYFAVVPNGGSYRASGHEFRILFNGRTRVVADDTPEIPLNAFSFMSSHEINLTMGNCDFLADMIGLVTAISGERQYTKGSTVTRMIELEITDGSGKIKCALFGNYVDVVQEFAAAAGDELPIVIVQFAKIKTFKGDVVIQNVMHATKIYWNPDIPEALAFRNSLALNGVAADMPMGELDDDVRVIAIDEEFLTMFPRKSVSGINSTGESGSFIVYATIVDLLEGEKWWYSACRCHKVVTLEEGVYFCSGCDANVLEVIPRFRIKVEVSDFEDVATFVLFDSDCHKILQQSCKDLVVGLKGQSSEVYPDPIKLLLGKNLLFKVEKTDDHAMRYDGSFKVKKICDDPMVIQTFKNEENITTPKKSIKVSKFTDLHVGLEEVYPEGGAGYFGDNSSNVVAAATALDQISPGETAATSSSAAYDVGDVGNGVAAKRIKLKAVKIEKE